MYTRTSARYSNIKERSGVEIEYTIVVDLTIKVASAYGMILPGASNIAAVRATLIIDSEGVLRAMVCYPITTGHSMDEIHRVLVAPRTADKDGCAMPANGMAGEPVITPPPKTQIEARARAPEGYDTVDWFFSPRKL